MAGNRYSNYEDDISRLMLDTKRVREMLTSIVNCHEQSLDPAVGHPGPFSLVEIRQALASAGHLLIGDTQLSTGKFRSKTKHVSATCTLTFSVKYHIDNKNEYDILSHRFDLCMLDIAISRAYLIQLSVTIHGAQDIFDSSLVGFKDWRSRKEQAASRSTMENDYRHLWRGLRWLCANLLTWHRPGMILPECLDDMGFFLLLPPDIDAD